MCVRRTLALEMDPSSVWACVSQSRGWEKTGNSKEVCEDATAKTSPSSKVMSLSALSVGVIDFAGALALSKLHVHFALPITARNTWHRLQAGVCCELQ